MLRIQTDTLRTEMEQIDQLIKSLKERVDNGVPGDDLPANDVDIEVYQVRLQYELMLAAQRLMALAEVIGGD